MGALDACLTFVSCACVGGACTRGSSRCLSLPSGAAAIFSYFSLSFYLASLLSLSWLGYGSVQEILAPYCTPASPQLPHCLCRTELPALLAGGAAACQNIFGAALRRSIRAADAPREGHAGHLVAWTDAAEAKGESGCHPFASVVQLRQLCSPAGLRPKPLAASLGAHALGRTSAGFKQGAEDWIGAGGPRTLATGGYGK